MVVVIIHHCEIAVKKGVNEEWMVTIREKKHIAVKYKLLWIINIHMSSVYEKDEPYV